MTTPITTKEKAAKKIAENCAKMRWLLDECVSLADAHGVMFETPWGGEGSSESGLGGTYVSIGSDPNEWYDYKGWNPSSRSC